MKQTAEIDRLMGRDALIVHEQEGGSGGKDSARATTLNLAGYRVESEHPTGDKVTRSEPMQAQASASNVKIVQGSWVPGFLSEITAFPSGGHDDQVDACSGAFNRLALSWSNLLLFGGDE